MHRLGRRHEVDRTIREPAGLGGSDAVGHARVRCRLRDLRLARVGRDDVGEKTSQAYRRLAAPRGAVPGCLTRRRRLCQNVEQGIGIARPEHRVAGRNRRKVIGEAHGRAGVTGGVGGGTGGGVVRCGCWQSGHAPGCPFGRGGNTSRLPRGIRVVSSDAR